MRFALAIQLASAICAAQPLIVAPLDRSSVQTLGAAIADQAQSAHPSGACALMVRADLPGAPRGPALIDALIAPTLTAVPECERSATDGEGEAAVRIALENGRPSAIELHVSIDGNYLEIEGAVWQDAQRTGSIAARMRLDAELRHLVAPLERVSTDTLVARTAALPGRGYLAMWGADLDGDGSTEVVLLLRGGVEILHLAPSHAGLRLARIAQASFPNAPRAAVPRRRTLGTLGRIAGSLLARVSDRATTFRIEWRNGAIAIAIADSPCGAEEFPIEGGCARLVEGRDFFDAEVHEGATIRQAQSSFYARAAARMRAPAGDTIEYEAIVTMHGRVAVRAGDRSHAASGYGTALALGDLDDDGMAEILLSSSRPIGSGDQLTVVRVWARGALPLVWRSEILPGSVMVAAAGDLDADGRGELWAIEEPAEGERAARLWVVR